MDSLLQQGITAYRAGKREEARKIFISVVKENPENEYAWGWMYQTSNHDRERIYCLKQMLRINPKNEKTSQALNQLLAPPPAPISPPSQVNTPVIATKKCPRCQELVPTGVPRCKNCGWDFHEEKAARQSRKLNKKSSPILWVLGVFFLLAICGVSYGLAIGAVKTIGPVATPTRTTEENAWYACTLFVEKQLKVAAFDAQRYNSSGVILLDNSKYRVDVDYAKLTTTFTCFLQDHADGNWELINLVATKK